MSSAIYEFTSAESGAYLEQLVAVCAVASASTPNLVTAVYTDQTPGLDGRFLVHCVDATRPHGLSYEHGMEFINPTYKCGETCEQHVTEVSDEDFMDPIEELRHVPSLCTLNFPNVASAAHKSCTHCLKASVEYQIYCALAWFWASIPTPIAVKAIANTMAAAITTARKSSASKIRFNESTDTRSVTFVDGVACVVYGGEYYVCSELSSSTSSSKVVFCDDLAGIISSSGTFIPLFDLWCAEAYK